MPYNIIWMQQLAIAILYNILKLSGIYGYTAYSAGKWAVRGLAEALHMELVGTNVRQTLVFPPDTDTPGFANEELTKPNETKLISSSGGLHSPDEIGKKLIHDAMVSFMLRKTLKFFKTTSKDSCIILFQHFILHFK